MEGATKEWVVGGKIALIGLALSYLMLLRASESFAEDDCRLPSVWCLNEEEVAFYVSERQVE